MNIKQFKRSDALRVMNWCKKNIGINYRRKYLPDLEWHTGRDESWDCGDYDFDDNLITVYKGSHRSVVNLIHTIIHEWCHYLQSKKKYYEYDKQLGYENNPLEHEANRIAELYKFLSDYYGRNNRLFNPVALKDVDTAAISNQYNHLLELKNAIANGLPPTKLQAILYRIALASIKLTTNLPLGAQRDNFVKL